MYVSGCPYKYNRTDVCVYVFIGVLVCQEVANVGKATQKLFICGLP